MYFSMYLVAKYMRSLNFLVTPKIDNPLGTLSWVPMGSLSGEWGQTLINGAYEAL